MGENTDTIINADTNREKIKMIVTEVDSEKTDNEELKLPVESPTKEEEEEEVEPTVEEPMVEEKSIFVPVYVDTPIVPLVPVPVPRKVLNRRGATMPMFLGRR